MTSRPNYAYVRYVKNKEMEIVPIKFIRHFTAHCNDDFNSNTKYKIKQSANNSDFVDGVILMLAGTREEIKTRIENGPRFKYPTTKQLNSFEEEEKKEVQFEEEEEEEAVIPKELEGNSENDESGSESKCSKNDDDDEEDSEWDVPVNINRKRKHNRIRIQSNSSEEEESLQDQLNLSRSEFLNKARRRLFISNEMDLTEKTKKNWKQLSKENEVPSSSENNEESIHELKTDLIPREPEDQIRQPTEPLQSPSQSINSPKHTNQPARRPLQQERSANLGAGTNAVLQVEDNQNLPPKYAKVRDEVHLGSNVWVQEEAWELLEDEECDSKFVKGLVTAIYGKRNLMLRTFRADLLKNKTIEGINTPVKTFSPHKFEVMKQCFKDKLKKNKKLSAKERKKALGKMSQYIAVKRRDTITQYYKKNGYLNRRD